MSFWEIFVILVVALIVIGPKQLPEIARRVGQFINTIQKLFNKVSSDINNELMLKNNEQRATAADLEYVEKEKK